MFYPHIFTIGRRELVKLVIIANDRRLTKSRLFFSAKQLNQMPSSMNLQRRRVLRHNQRHYGTLAEWTRIY